MDMLENIFKRQIEMHNKLGLTGNDFNLQYQKDMILAAIDELTEALRELPWKPWKKNQIYNKVKHQNELIDVLHFLVNLFIASGMDATKVYLLYHAKNLENINRIKQGY